MRITTGMTTNRMLLNINRNATAVDRLWQQQSTTKKILFASENPILASRALKFRTNISNTAQFNRNVQQGLSWMEITEGGFNNMMAGLRDIRTNINYAATGTNELPDRDALLRSIETIFEQLQSEMNIDYAGRHVFSGFRTDQPMTFTTDQPDAAFFITQQFNPADIERTTTFVRTSVGAEPEIFNIFRIKLPYNLNMPHYAYNDADPPELVQVGGNGFDALGPFQRFDGTAIEPPGVTLQTVSTANPQLLHDALNQERYFVFVPEKGEFKMDETTARYFMNHLNGFLVSYQKQGFSKGELNPVVNFHQSAQMVDFEGQTIDPPRVFNMNNQALRFEFGANTQFQINSLGMNIMTPQLYADLKNLIEFTRSIQPATAAEIETWLLEGNPDLTPEELEYQINRQQIRETQIFAEAMFDRLNNMLDLMDRHMSQVSTEFTALGSRMNRLEMITERLEQDRLSYTRLMSENEDADLLEVIMRLNAAEAVFQASLRAGANILQISLADFIR